MYVIGIDGGGTATKGVIANVEGEIFAEATVGATNPNSISGEEVEAEFRKLFSLLRDQSKEGFSRVQKVFAGMSGVGNTYAKKDMQERITSLLTVPEGISVDNDAIIALYSGTMGKPGIVQIAGTGSITYGVNKKGVRDRVGGWGYLIGEEAGGFALGRDGLDAAFRAHDGLQEDTEIRSRLLDYYQKESLPHIIQPVYQRKNVKEGIASLSKVVIEAYDNGDRSAKDIVRRNGLYMGESIVCLVNKLFSEDELDSGIPVVVVGGIFNRLELFKPHMVDVFNRSGLDVRLIAPEMEPVGGAVIAALQELNATIPPDFTNVFRMNDIERK